MDFGSVGTERSRKTMRNVQKPSEIPAVLIDSEAQTHFTNILRNKEVKESDCKIYRKVALNLFDIYNGKCCYCETYISGTEIEHYRPKNKYYWLAYSWDNVMPICSQCNRNKGLTFKISGNEHKIDSINSVESAQNTINLYNEKEKPILVNPETDKIGDDTFIFEEDGFIISNDKRFSESITALKLNRYELLEHRKRHFDNLKVKIAEIDKDFSINDKTSEHKKVLQHLVKEAYNIKNDYIALRKYLIKFYKEYFSI